MARESMAREEEARRMEMKYASLKEDYAELEQYTGALKKRVEENKDKKKQLKREVRFLSRKYQMFTEKDWKEPAYPLVSPEFGAKALSIYGRPNEPTKVLAIEEEPASCELTGLQPLMSTNHRATPEMTRLRPSAMRIVPDFKVPHGSLATAAFVDRQNEKIKANPFESPECSAKIFPISGIPKEQTAGLARHELAGMQPFLSTNGCTMPEMSGLQPSAMKIMPGFKMPHSPLVTPTIKPANKKSRLENNGPISAQKPSKVKDGRIRKIKADPLVSPEFIAKITSISRKPKEPIEAVAIEDKPASYKLTGMQPLRSTDDHTLPEMTGLQPSAKMIMPGFKVLNSPLVTPTVEPANKKRHLENNGLISAQKPSKVKDGRIRKIKADPSVSPEFITKIASISRKPKEPTEALGIEDEPARYKLTGMQPLPSTDDCTLPEMPSTMMIMPGFKVSHSPLVTPTLEPANKKRCLENNGLISSQKPSKVKDGRIRKTKADPLVSPEFIARTTSISRKPKEPTEALTNEDEPASYKLIGMQPLPSTVECTLSETTGVQPSATKIMTDFTVPNSSLVTPIVEPANKKRHLKNNGLVSVQKTSNVKDGQDKKIAASPSVSQKCGAENLSNSRRPKEPTEVFPIEDGPTRHELPGLQLFSSSDACTSPEMPSAARMMPAVTVLPSSLGTPVAKPTIKKKLQNNGLATAQKPSKVRDSQRKKIKDSPQKPISLIEKRDVGSFWDN